MRDNINMCRAIGKWGEATPSERSKTVTCKTCGYPAHRSKRSVTMCPFAKKYRGVLPKRKHRNHKESRTFV